MDGQVKETAKSLSVPDLIGYLDETRLNILFVSFFMQFKYMVFRTLSFTLFVHRTQDAKPVSLKPQQSSNGGRSGKDIEINVCAVVDVNGSNGCSKDDGTPEFSQQWDKVETESSRSPPETETEEEQKDAAQGWDEKETEGCKGTSTEQKLYRIANELLQTERAYVARLHLLDQVGKVQSVSFHVEDLVLIL